jgi:hypothetical protein
VSDSNDVPEKGPTSSKRDAEPSLRLIMTVGGVLACVIALREDQCSTVRNDITAFFVT